MVTNAVVTSFGETVWYFSLPYHVALYLNDAVHSFVLIKLHRASHLRGSISLQ